jgi:hypothetical protein
MADRLADLVVGLQRMAENARIRGDDLRYTQQQETCEHVQWLDHLLGMVGKVNTVLIEERRKFAPAERQAVQNDPMPRIVKQGPLPQHLRPKEQAAE